MYTLYKPGAHQCQAYPPVCFRTTRLQSSFSRLGYAPEQKIVMPLPSLDIGQICIQAFFKTVVITGHDPSPPFNSTVKSINRNQFSAQHG